MLRLPSSEDFKRVRAARRSVAHPLLLLYSAPNELGRPRVGVTVSRRSAREFGKAVVRNRVRRRVSEAARRRLADSATGLDLVFVARGPSATADWPALSGAVEELLRRARALTPALSQGERGNTLSPTLFQGERELRPRTRRRRTPARETEQLAPSPPGRGRG